MKIAQSPCFPLHGRTLKGNIDQTLMKQLWSVSQREMLLSSFDIGHCHNQPSLSLLWNWFLIPSEAPLKALYKPQALACVFITEGQSQASEKGLCQVLWTTVKKQTLSYRLWVDISLTAFRLYQWNKSGIPELMKKPLTQDPTKQELITWE